jgi:hypothetical protein
MWNSLWALRRSSGCEAALDSVVGDEKLADAASIRERSGRKGMFLKVRITSRNRDGTFIFIQSPHGVELIVDEERRCCLMKKVDEVAKKRAQTTQPDWRNHKSRAKFYGFLFKFQNIMRTKLNILKPANGTDVDNALGMFENLCPVFTCTSLFLPWPNSKRKSEQKCLGSK